MAQRTIRPWLGLAVAALAAAVFLPACWNGGPLGPLFGANGNGSGDGGFDPGTGGGLTLKDLFVGARLERKVPKVVKVAPTDSSKDVSLKSPIVVEFTESMVASALRNGLQLFAQGSTQATGVSVFLFNGDSVAVLVPNSDLLPSTVYEISVAGNLTDLQGQQIDIGDKKSTDQRFRFTTIAATGDPPFDVIYSSPAQQAGNVPRGGESVIVFSEPFSPAISGGGINAPGNLVVKRGNTTLVQGTDYSVGTFPSAAPRVVNVAFATIQPANTKMQVVVASDVTNADGRKTLKGGAGFTDEYTTQDAAIPASIDFPASVPVTGKDGSVASSTLHAFPANVNLTSDGTNPDETTIIYFDAGQQNALLFSKAGSNPTDFVSDLQPQSTPALLDGDILVGSFVERRGFRSEVSVVETIVKDTIGPRLLSLGPPGFGNTVFFSVVNDPVIHGKMSEPCTGIQIDFDGAGAPDFNSVQFAAGQSTVTDDFFVTGATEDAPLPAQLEGKQTFSFLCSDLYGNGAANLDSFTHLTVGKVGATVSQPDGVSALYVAAYAEDNFQFFLSGGAVLLDAFPPEADGAHQIVKGLAANVGVVRFTDAELASIPTTQVTVTVIAKRQISGFPPVLFGPMTFAGLDKPTAASPRAIVALLSPPPSISLRNKVHCDILGGSANSPTFAGSAFSSDVLPTTPEFDRVVPLIAPSTFTQNLLDLPLNRLQLFSVAETVTIGTTNLFRFTSSEPFTADFTTGGSGGGGTGQNKSRTADFSGHSQYDAATHPELVHSIDFDDDQVSYDKPNGAPGLPGPIGLRGSSADQLRELRLIARVPGFADNAAVANSTAFTSSAPPDFTGQTLLPLPFLQNNSVSSGIGFEDSPLELLLQPTLLDPATAVDTAKLRRALRLEMIVQDKIVFGTTIASSAYSRERFLFDPTATSAHLFTPQEVPIPTVTSATHPPALRWKEVTNGEGMHCLKLVSVLDVQTWKIFIPSQPGATVDFQVPFIPSSLPDGVGLIGFALAGTYQGYIESFDFDPNHVFDGTTPEQYNFDPQSWWQTDLEREFLRASRSDPNFVFTTN